MSMRARTPASQPLAWPLLSRLATSWLLWLGLVTWPIPLCHAQRQSASADVPGVVRFENVESLIERWQTDQHLYVRGDLGVGARQLSELNNWLSQHAPHWTVVLMSHAEDQSYTARDGRHYNGLDAVEYALGLGLSNQTDFGELAHPITKESDGAVFALFLKERKFSYFASDAQDLRGLGEAHWVGELDQPAFRAMRSGGRILDAVKDTIQNINQKLEQSIAREQKLAQDQAERRARELAQVQSSIEQAESSVQEISQAAAKFSTDHPKASGPMARPPVTQWREKLEALKAQLNAETTTAVEQDVSALAVELARHQNAYASQNHFQQHIKEVETRIRVATESDAPPVQQLAKEASQAALKAHGAIDAGQLEFMQHLQQSEEILKQADAAADAFRRQQELEAMRWRWIRGTIVAMLAALGLIIAALLAWSNRRRRGTMLKAMEQLESRAASITKETEHLDKLFQRNEEILGSREKIADRGYVGRTRTLALQAFDYVDDLFIMSKEVKRVLAEARSLVEPANAWHQFINLVSGSRYQQAIDHVTGAPLKFSRVTGIPLIIRDMKLGVASAAVLPTAAVPPGAANNDAVTPSELPDEVSLTFEEIFAAFQQRGIEAQAALNTIENCLANVQDELNKAQTDLARCADQEKQLDNAAHDGYFSVPNYFEQLIPSIQEHLKQADDLSAFNAVESMEGPLARAKQQLLEAFRLGNLLHATREKMFPQFQQSTNTLKQLGYSANWIGAELNELSEQANDLYSAAVTRSIGQDVDSLEHSMTSLGQRNQRIVALATELNEQHAPALDELRESIDDSRRDVAKSLRLQPTEVLHELDRDPDDFLSRARISLNAGKAMLLQGRVDAVESAIAALISESKQAAAILEATRTAVKEFSQKRQTVQDRIAASQKRLPGLHADTTTARSMYAAAAMLVGANIPHSNGAQTSGAQRSIDWILSQADQGLTAATSLLDSSNTHQKTGEVLAAADDLSNAANLLNVIEGQVSQVTEHLQALESRSRENQAEHQRNANELESLQEAERNPMVTRVTLSAIDRLAAAIASDAQLIVAHQPGRNPFEAALKIQESRRQLEQLQSQIVGDYQAHAEAQRAVVGASEQLQAAQMLVRRSMSDGIPDSPEITNTTSRVAQLTQLIGQLQNELNIPHGDWKSVDVQAAKVQAELSSSTRTLNTELSAANQALAAFQQASQSVLQAGQWSGAWGVRVSGSPGVSELERARRSLQGGNYNSVLQLSQVAMSLAQTAIQQAEREIQRRRLEQERALEAERRAREAATRHQSSPSFGGGNFGVGVSSNRSSGGTSFGSSSSSSSSGGSSSGGSGFSRSGW